ncbi:MAG: hydrogenase [Deltaproteobacteria bacterium]|nr:hydrogenase [Deltaproteobacteria bacterium]
MQIWLDAILVLLILTNLKLVGSSRLVACLKAVAAQGILLSLVPLILAAGHYTPRVILLSLLTMALKGMVFPWLLWRVLQSVGVRREIEPFVGYTTSLLVGAGLLGLAIWLAGRLPLPGAAPSELVLPLALFTTMTGLFTMVSRKKALSQVLGYLVMENGIYAFGLAFALEEPLLVELGTLLDVFMAVFIMGIMLFHLNREFDHIDADRLSALKD